MESSWWTTYILAFSVIGLFLYKYLKEKSEYWMIRDVPYIKANWILGNMYDVFFGNVPISLLQLHLYRKLAPNKYGGYFQFQKPILLVRDPELIKKVLTKDFQYFHDRGMKFHPEIEPLSQQLFVLNGEQWKNLRIKLTPTFSSGKMKTMIPLMEKCALELVSVLNNDDEKSTTTNTITITNTGDINNSPKELCADKIDTNNIDIKDLLSRYMGDAIASCAFGIETGIVRNPNSEFRLKAKKILEFRYKSIIRLLFPNISPTLIKMFNLRFFPKDITDFYMTVVKDMIEHRENNRIVRNDFLNLLINLKNNFNLEQARKDHSEIGRLEQLVLDENVKGTSSNIDMTLDTIASQCFLFLGAAFEMTGTVMTFGLFEIARHADVDEKLKREIDDVLQKYDGQLTYYALKDMKYLDMVLAETLRMYPAAPAIMRLCTADYKLEDLMIPKGSQVLISVMGLHYDEEYFENPEQFNPANFNEEAKSQRHQYAYLPFGEGPRVCIAERFAKLQIKIAMVHLIKNYQFRLSPKMQLPIEFENNLGFLAVKGGIWLQCHQRE